MSDLRTGKRNRFRTDGGRVTAFVENDVRSRAFRCAEELGVSRSLIVARAIEEGLPRARELIERERQRERSE